MESSLSKVSVLMFLAFAMVTAMALGQGTKVGFYSSTCPRAESIVQSTVKKHVQNDSTVAPGLLRMIFHDCFVHGCDASILISGSSTEKTARPNLLLRGYEVIDDAKTQLEAACPGVVSCADILALAARDSAVLAGALTYRLPTGRRDGRVSLASDTANLPSFTDSVDVQKQKFSDKGLSTQDLVTLVGGHTIGTVACQFIRYRLYNFTSSGAADPTIDPKFLPTLQSLCPANGNGNKRIGLDYGSSHKFDHSFFKNVRDGRGILESDQRLWADASTKTFVQRFFGIRGLAGLTLNVEFGKAMIKMSNIEVKTGNNGYDPSSGFHREEREALLALQSSKYETSYSAKDVTSPPSSFTAGDHSSGDSSGEEKKFKYAFLLAVADVIGLILIGILFIIYYKKQTRLKVELRRLVKLKKDEETLDEEKRMEDKGKRVADHGEEKDKDKDTNNDKGQLKFMEGVPSFELRDLFKASAEGLGKGNFGSSYKAVLDDGRAVVVKRLRDLKPLSSDEFNKQVTGIAELKHPNLLPLLGYYYSKDEKFLVYKFAANGNLFNRLHGARGTKDRIPFRWSSRLAVARAVARVLEYMHSHSNTQTVPHANLKASNILLDEDDNVLVSDYGLTSIIATQISAQRMVSYKSPEFQISKRVSKKSDVWCFGSILLELLTGKVSVHSAPQAANGIDLCSWVHRAVREEWTAEIFDAEISTQRSNYSGMLRLLQTAIKCCDKLPDKRPNMSDLMRELESVKSVANSEEDDSFTDGSDSFSEPSITIGDDRI